MSDLWNYGLLFFALLAGAATVFLAFQLQKRYEGFTSSYAYYILLFYIFGAYSVAGSEMIVNLLSRMGADVLMAETSSFYIFLPGIPLLALAHYMFVRSFRDYFKKPLPVVFSLVYFLLLLLIFGLYTTLLVRYSHFETGDAILIRNIQDWIYRVILLLAYPWAFVDVLRFSRGFERGRKVQLRFIAISYLAYGLILLSGSFLLSFSEWVPRLLLLIMLVWHLVPMFFLNILLEKNVKLEKLEVPDFASQLKKFVEKHEISKRESEVVRLICAGMSNQEISETLFISLQTVKDHIHRIFVKTGVKNRVQLTNMIR